MRRSGVPAPQWHEPEASGKKVDIRVQVVTPLFGGGYDARQVDAVCIIRPAAIRGQLRFWWRATAGVQYSSPEELFEAESALWGRADKPGCVRISVAALERTGSQVRLDRAEVPDYVRAFLVQEKTGTEKAIRQKYSGDSRRIRDELERNEAQVQKEKDDLYPFVQPGASFQLRLHLADKIHWTEVAESLKAFLLFGGVGGRSRRGYGCLACDDVAPELQGQSLRTGDAWFSAIPAAPAGLVSLRCARLFVGKPVGKPFDAWETAAKMLHHFRKAEVPGSLRPNRGAGSHTTWPEADMLRQIKTPPIHPLNPAFALGGCAPAFPRAQLGLPLRFQSYQGQAGAFGECEISLRTGSENVERLASPVIVKPLRLGGRWHPAIVILNSTGIANGQLQLSTDESIRPTVDCIGAPAGLWDGSRDVPFTHPHSNVLDVLASYLQTQAHWTQKKIGSL